MLKNIALSLPLVMALALDSYGSNVRNQEADALISTDHTKTYSLPAATDTLVGRASTDTLTNKSLSGASNTFTSIPASAVSSGQLALANGGTAANLTASNGALVYSGASALALSSVGSSGQVAKSGGAGAPTFGEVGVSKQVYVDKSGNDSTCVAGSINRPCLTIAAGIGKCTSLSASNQCVVSVGPGSFNEGTTLNLKNFVHVMGTPAGNALGGDNHPTKIVTDNGVSWSGTTATLARTGISNASLSSTGGIDIDVTFPSASNIYLYLENVETTGAVSFVSASANNKNLAITNSFFASDVTMTGAIFYVRDTYVGGNMTISSGTIDINPGNLIGVFLATGQLDLNAPTNLLAMNVLGGQAQGATLEHANVTLVVDAISVTGGNIANPGGGTVVYTTSSSIVNYAPAISGNWTTAPTSTADALDKVASGNFSTQGYQLNTSGSQPSCAVGFRGLLWGLEGGTGVADAFQVCQKNAADAYVWTSPGSGGVGGSIYGTAKITGCAGSFARTSGSFGSLSTQTGCSYAVTGNAAAPATQIAAFKFASLPAGTYHVVYIGEVELAGAVNDAGVFVFNDGTTQSLENNRYYYGGNGQSNSMEGTFIYGSTQTNITFEIQAKNASGGGLQTNVYGTTSAPGVLILYKYQ